MAELTTAEKLAQAEAALHALLTGKSARVVVDQNGERVEFTSINLGALRAYIDELRGAGVARGPLRPYF